MVGRKKICRSLEVDVDGLQCVCFGPLTLDCKELEQRKTIILKPDEYQTILYQDKDNLTMDQASKKMGISKTVYAGLYKAARKKLAQMLDENRVLTICSAP